ncbi:MAG: hypothetical protein Q9166_001506 [cf. Caloplaca sp. 2 TL-2023]
METFANRLESFKVIHPSTKKRTSNAKAAPKLKWPHSSPDPAQLARAGFFYNPTASTPDGTTCYLCHCNLDGWEEDDSAIGEHLSFSPHCGWATIAQIEQDVEDGNHEHGNTMDERLLDARRMTFGVNWPHENKRGWLCKTEKGLSMVDTNIVADTSLMPDVEPVAAKKAAKGAKKGWKGKKAAAISKGKSSTAQQEEAVVGSSFVEPEDDDFEVKIERKSAQSTRGKKRKSDEMSLDCNSPQPEPNSGQSQSQLPPTKRRATRSSVSYENKAPISTFEFTLDDDTHMKDSEEVPPPPQATSKKTAKRGRKRGSSSLRKTSTISTASKASLRATLPNDEELDAALEADLDRPLTDDEDNVEPPPIPKTKTRRLTKTRPGSRNDTASTAPVQRVTRASALPLEGDSTTNADVPTYHSSEPNDQEAKPVEIALNAVDHAKQEIIAETDKQIASKAKTRGRPPSKSTKSTKTYSKPVPVESSAVDQSYAQLESGLKTDQLTAKDPRTSELSIASIEGNEAIAINSSVLDPSAAFEESGNEGNATTASQNHTKKGGKKRTAAAAKNSKASKKGTAPKLEEVIRVEVEGSQIISPKPVVELQISDDQNSIEEAPLPKAAKPKKGKPAKAKVNAEKPTLENASIESAEPYDVSSATVREEPNAPEEVSVKGHQGQGDNEVTPTGAATPQNQAPVEQETPKTTISPQSSDAENQPPSSRPSALRPPLTTQSPSKVQNTRVVLTTTTPTASPSKRHISQLRSTLPWTSIDFEKLFIASPTAEKENVPLAGSRGSEEALTSPEKRLTVEEWIRWNAKRGEEKLRDDCERLVGRFEGEGVRALKTLEGIVCAE